MSALTATLRKPKDKTHKIGLFGRVKLVVFKLLYGHVGGLAAVGGYFFVTQLLHGQHTTIGHKAVTLPDIKWAWDHLFDQIIPVMSHSAWNVERHLIRPLYEGIFGGLLYALVAFNPFKVKVRDRPPLLSRAAIKARFIPTVYRPVTALQIIVLPLTITLFSIPGVAFGYAADRALRAILKVKSLAPTLSNHPSVVDKFYSGAFDAKIIGVFGSVFFAGRVAKPVFNYILRFFAERRAISGKKLRFYHPPAFKFLVRDYKAEWPARTTRTDHGRLVAAVVPSATFTVVALAGLGYYVLRYIA